MDIRSIRFRAVQFAYFLLGFCFLPHLTQAQVIEKDSLALVALYDSTEASNWNNKQNWLSGPVSSWRGISVTSGRVSAINLRANNLVGSLAFALNDLDSLVHLDLSYNRLRGALPGLNNSRNLQILDLGNNLFAGEIPQSWGDLTRLIVLKIENNHGISGPLPPELNNLAELKLFWFYGTGLCGIVDATTVSWLANVDDLRGECLPDNPDPPPVPVPIAERDSLALVALFTATKGHEWTVSSNWLSGPLVTWYGVSLKNGQVDGITLIRNNLVGQLPAELSDLDALVNLRLGKNELVGSLPDLQKLTKLKVLDLQTNQLSGALPILTSYSDIQAIDLSENQFTGRVPESWGFFRNLSSLKIQNNPGLTGLLPQSFTRLLRLNVFWFFATDLCITEEGRFQSWFTNIFDAQDSGCSTPIPWYPQPANCTRPESEMYLNANNVRARILNTGGLFYRGEPHVYAVPKYSGSNAIFASAIWVGGLVAGQVRVAATRYGPNEFWAGPLNDQGAPPGDCSEYDRMYKISSVDIEEYEQTGRAIPDLYQWPTGLGAPTVDSMGVRIDLNNVPFETRKDRTIDLAAGERPGTLGDEMIWWVMNDRGNEHEATDSPALGIEVHGSAFAASSWHGSINNTTLYRYRIINRNTSAIEKTYFGLFVDPDLGDAGDDYVGSDSVRGIAYVYNADNSDIAGEGYGTPPPAVGIRVLEGPLADDDGVDNDRDGSVDEPGERLGMSHFMVYGGGGGVTGDPRTGTDYYNYMRTRWKNGDRVVEGGFGSTFYGDTGVPTNYFYSGDPTTGEFWSEMNTDGQGTRGWAGDRRFVWSTGPFDLDPGEAKEVTFAIVWALGDDHLDSINEMKHASDIVQLVYDTGFIGIPKGPALKDSVSLLSPANGATNQTNAPTLVWNRIIGVNEYEIMLHSAQGTKYFASKSTSFQIENVDGNQIYFWRVRGATKFGFGPWSDTRFFVTGLNQLSELPLRFTTTRNAGGRLNPPDIAAFAANNSGFALLPCPQNPIVLCSSPTSGYQQNQNMSTWVIHAGIRSAEYGPITNRSSFLGRLTDKGATKELIGDFDYEWRWVGLGRGGIGFDERSNFAPMDVGFELWNIGRGTPDNPGDDYRMIPIIDSYNGGYFDAPRNQYSIGGDHIISPGQDDPYTNYTSWYNPDNTTPGAIGLIRYVAGTDPLGDVVFHDMVLVKLNVTPGSSDRSSLPERGTVFRIETVEFQQPVTAAPANEERLSPGPVRFYWSSPFEGRYRLQISRISDFSTIALDLKNVEPGVAPPLYWRTRYYWRVKAEKSAWSHVASFTITDDPEAAAPGRSFELSGNFPNPFSSTTSIGFFLPITSHVRMEIFDMLGRSVDVPLDELRVQGQNFFEYSASHLPSGVYFYTLATGKVSKTGKMVLMR